MREAVIIDAVRTPVGRGKPGGALSGWHPVDLFAHTLRGLLDRTGLSATEVDDVICGCVTQGGQQSMNVGRHAVLAAGFPESVPATTIDRQCGSSQQAVHFAAQGILAGSYDVAIAGGVEVMSRVPMFSATGSEDPFGHRIQDRYEEGLVPQGISAELIAARWGLDREDVDRYAARSHQHAAAALAEGRLGAELLPTPVDRGSGRESQDMASDEGVRPDSSIETLAALPAVFTDASLEARFPELRWVVTAGNASQISDGAGAVLLAERQVAERLGLMSRARVHAMDVVGDDPLLMLTGVIPATRRVLARAGLEVDDIDVYEVNEAFASVVLAWLHEIGADPSRVNINGGAIANGHPLGASGAKLMATLLHELERSGGRFGLQAMCEGGGMANATIIERL